MALADNKIPGKPEYASGCAKRHCFFLFIYYNYKCPRKGVRIAESLSLAKRRL